jgi:hypothetical protein
VIQDVYNKKAVSIETAFLLYKNLD